MNRGDGSAFLHSNGALAREDELIGANKSEQGTEVRSRMQARRSLPATLDSYGAFTPPPITSRPHRAIRWGRRRLPA